MSGKANLKALTKKWYAKLKRSGFQDLEGDDQDGLLSNRGNGADKVKKMTADEIEQTKEFYALVCAFLYVYTFKDALDEEIWALFSQGLTHREIGVAVNMSFVGVHKRIQKLLLGSFEDFRKMTLYDCM